MISFWKKKNQTEYHGIPDAVCEVTNFEFDGNEIQGLINSNFLMSRMLGEVIELLNRRFIVSDRDLNRLLNYDFDISRTSSNFDDFDDFENGDKCKLTFIDENFEFDEFEAFEFDADVKNPEDFSDMDRKYNEIIF